METFYVVIAVTLGSGESFPGSHVWSDRFVTKAAAEAAKKFIEGRDKDCRAIVIGDPGK